MTSGQRDVGGVTVEYDRTDGMVGIADGAHCMRFDGVLWDAIVRTVEGMRKEGERWRSRDTPPA